jgi:hypothetical protein
VRAVERAAAGSAAAKPNQNLEHSTGQHGHTT